LLKITGSVLFFASFGTLFKKQQQQTKHSPSTRKRLNGRSLKLIAKCSWGKKAFYW